MKHTHLLLAAVLLAPLAALNAADASAKKPNIVFILADDLGFETLGAYGAKEYQGLGAVRTPNLDALAKGGMRFGNCFATPVCSPARLEIMTGKYNFRTGFRDIAGRNGAVSSLDSKAHPTIAATLKSAGYVTAQGVWLEISLDGGGVKDEVDGPGRVALVDLEASR